MKKASDIIIKLLAIILLIAAVLKGWQLLTEPMANNDIWSYRPFLILTVEFELALGIWLLSGLFKKAAWLAVISCFSLFSVITFYKGLTGYASCGCFGKVHVNPWITLFAIDLPGVMALLTFRPALSFLPHIIVRRELQWESIKAFVHEFIAPLPSISRFTLTACLAVIVLGVTTPILAFNKPAMITSAYEVLEPETWVGKELPILKHIDIAETLRKGTWLVLLYHYDCPGCSQAIPMYEQMARDLSGNGDFLRIAFIEVPPYGLGPLSENSPCAFGRLADIKEWFVITPAVALLTDGWVRETWERKTPDLNTILQKLANLVNQISRSECYSKT